MRPVIIGAGRGSRLQHETNEIPKTLVKVMGKPMLEWILEALAAGGFARKDVIFICGYQAHVIQEQYPEFTYVHNTEWQNNNILESLIYARELLKDGFISTYADIVYWPKIIEQLVKQSADISLVCDTEWRRRYVFRTQHPETDAEKLSAQGSKITRISRTIPSEEAAGEFIGVTRFSPQATVRLLSAYDHVSQLFPQGEFREGRTLRKAYLIDLFQWMLEHGESFERLDTPGGYMELDTLQDLRMAEAWWAGGSGTPDP
jgi:L-glutamine-phosphate cytidylyltransferase